MLRINGKTEVEGIVFSVCVNHYAVELVCDPNDWLIRVEDLKSANADEWYLALLNDLKIEPGEEREISRREWFKAVRLCVHFCVTNIREDAAKYPKKKKKK